MNIQPLFKVQKKYNDSLSINEELDSHKLRVRKNLEFEISLGALASETNCFSYLLKKSRPVNISAIFDKYITCVSQVLTLGIDHKYTDLIAVSMTPNDYCLSDQFLNLYIDINDLIAFPSIDHYLTLFEDLLSLGLTLGFSESQIQNQFIKDLDNLVIL
ncbi:dUTP diphosphatase [Clostridium beijerinckii]|uniref:dUTPase n=1 Tax=Clostridium beijerinckii TaxID=1520 RepID=A0A1S8S4P7_CLOBE|nr:dUTP diphosphatase [Clostridium beijerinckii]NMF07685.1 dUTPase [Clostridium beijerinckii]NRY60925.1 dimeric dUTPase (all-alpha-NTP-PPase superfamily) [Clostridium beijerinckii]OOM60438.1 dUTPase [Clostridium beijerinckii]